MSDVLPSEIAAWQRLESTARELFAAYGYREIRVPIVEQTALFKRSIGEFKDIVQKEMFTFVDPGGESLTLRPEATAGIVRAMITNGLLHNQKQRVWCGGPMFRHEKPQRGRFRQFHQLDREARHRAARAQLELARHARVAPRLPRAARRLLQRSQGAARCRQLAASRDEPVADSR